MRRPFLLIILLLMVVLGACKDNNSSSSSNEATPGKFGPFEWDRDPNTIIVRLDSLPEQETPAFLMNSIPPCTVWGDGRVVWTVRDPDANINGYEARISEAKMRAFLEDIFSRGFSTWEDELLPPSSVNPIVQTITVNMYDKTVTVKRYTGWPMDHYLAISKNCQQLSDKPVKVMPAAGWVSAWSIPRDTQSPQWNWGVDQPVTLKELAETKEAKWIEGDLAMYVWEQARQDRSDIQVIEGEEAYQVAIMVPGYSRDAPPPPANAQP
jgi:hypothetical protein